jgi:hypothetical protein
MQLIRLCNALCYIAMSSFNKRETAGSQTSVDSTSGRKPTMKQSPASVALPVGRSKTATTKASRSLSNALSPGPFGAGIKARRVRLYRNGDLYFSGITMIIASEHFRTFDALLAEINKSPVADPAILTKVTYAC